MDTSATAKRMAVPSIQAWDLSAGVAKDISTVIEKMAQTIKSLSMKSSRAARRSVQNGVLVGGAL